MKSISILLGLAFLLTGCATYKFHHGTAPYDKGYVVSRDDYTMAEYTLGRDNTVPKVKLAKERFRRRRNIVEDYYKRMGLVENRFKMVFVDPLAYFGKLVGGTFRLPWVIISDVRYQRDPKYRERVTKMEDEEDRQEEARINKLKEELLAYVKKDLEKNEPVK